MYTYTRVQFLTKRRMSSKRKLACGQQVRLKRLRCGEPRLLDAKTGGYFSGRFYYSTACSLDGLKDSYFGSDEWLVS